jgi:hypothetical protein
MPRSSFATDADLRGSKRGFAPKNKSGFGTNSSEVTRLSEIGREGFGCLYVSLAPQKIPLLHRFPLLGVERSRRPQAAIPSTPSPILGGNVTPMSGFRPTHPLRQA